METATSIVEGKLETREGEIPGKEAPSKKYTQRLSLNPNGELPLQPSFKACFN